MKQGWVDKKLMEIADVSTGKYDANHSNENGKYRFYTCAYNYGMCDTNRFSGESLILAGNGVNVGEVFYYDGEFDAYQRTYVINNIKIFPKYLHYHMLLFWKELGTKLQYGSATNFIKIGNFQNYDVSYPPLPEQQRIVAILDEAFAAITKAKTNAEQNLKNAKELFESYLQGVFENGNWEEKTLGEVCDFSQGIQRDVKLQSENQKDNQVRFLRIVDFTQGNEPPRYIDNPGEKYILNSNDVSLVRYGASTGFVCRGLEGALANNLFRVIPKAKKEIINDFLFIYLTAPVFQNVIKESMNGAAMPAISFGLIKDIPFPIISINEQQTIVQKLDALSAETKKLEAIYKQKINDLEELKKSVLQKAFSGELRGGEPVQPKTEKEVVV